MDNAEHRNQNTSEEPLLFLPELACKLRRSEWYVYQMKKAGFQMPGGTATFTEARQWLKDTGFHT